MTTTPRRPTDIAAVVRRQLEDARPIDVRRLLADLDALEACWPTADEVAEARAVVKRLAPRPRRQLTTFLDRLDPPQPQADDVDPWALLAAVVAPVASGADLPDRMAAIDAARAALDARSGS